ncbi:hypothetical protein ACFYRK_33090 [Streptomyces sp. NPDC005381]|uniref:hypothetical protein n=1 Tax=Streptomyces sp. NPDC005381 TaxID=3364714 RepID=UPI0036991955
MPDGERGGQCALLVRGDALGQPDGARAVRPVASGSGLGSLVVPLSGLGPWGVQVGPSQKGWSRKRTAAPGAASAAIPAPVSASAIRRTASSVGTSASPNAGSNSSRRVPGSSTPSAPGGAEPATAGSSGQDSPGPLKCPSIEAGRPERDHAGWVIT